LILLPGGWNSINFLRKTGLLGSTLAGTCTELPDKPGDDTSPPEADIPIGDDDELPDLDPEPTAPEPAPETKLPSKTVEEKIDDLTAECAKWTISPRLNGCEMQIKTACLTDIAVQGQPFDIANFFVVQCKVSGGCDLSRFDIEIDSDRGGGTATCPMDPAASKGSKRIKQAWKEGNVAAATALAIALHRSCKLDVLPGTDYEVDKGTFSWPKGLKSQPTMADPHDLGFRLLPAQLGKTLYEIENPVPVNKDKEGVTIVPCCLVTAFCCSNDPATKRETGDLRLPRRKEEVKKKKRRLHRQDDDDDDDDESMEIAFVEDASTEDADLFSNRHHATNAITRKKAPMSSLNAALGATTAAFIGMIAYFGMK